MIVNLVVFKHRVFFTSTLQLSLIPNNQTYSGDRELTQYFIRWTWWQKMINSHDSWKKITPAFRKTSMQLTEDNSTISVKVNVFSYYCCRLKRENLENLKYPQIWNPARVLHFYVFLLPCTALMIYPGCPWPTTFGCFHDRLHADHPDEHCRTLYNVLQTILLWGPGSVYGFITHGSQWFHCEDENWNNTGSRFRSISQ